MRSLSLVLVLALLSGAAFAAAGEVRPAAVAPSATEALAKSEANLGRWNALELASADDLLWDLSEYTGDCYGMPCGVDYDDAITKERGESAVRLAALDDIAERIAAAPPDGGKDFDRAAVDADIAALRALEIVSVQDFVETDPCATGHCYVPTPRMIAEAHAKDADRQALLHAIVVAAKAEIAPESGS